ncbi:tRNA uridine 5-carboxymethylaminomethyl modification protein [Platysternon megacephalum]|uniref:lysoplasmalogenase n=1 Tax=Platysternon megacephalum TaxID=55544 RepID=A0A4D9DG47_9SAUR|nr:tRNA uridine 5-carboxymethylaminomethyl modification protein [Platysternon megacephalum]
MKVQAGAWSWKQQPGCVPETRPRTMDILETDAHYRRNIAADAKSRRLKLLPFLASCGLFFALRLPEPSWVSVGVKILPLLSLVFFLTAQAWGDGAWTPAARRVCWGLMFSSVGDACLVWPQLFLLGMVAFALAHVWYIWALGLRPVRPWLLLLLALAWAGAYATLWPCLGGPYVPAVGGYGALLAAVAWRALARPPPHLAVASGFLLFMASDLVLARDHFCAPVPQARLIVMGTYYAAQGLIAAWAPRASPRWKEN